MAPALTGSAYQRTVTLKGAVATGNGAGITGKDSGGKAAIELEHKFQTEYGNVSVTEEVNSDGKIKFGVRLKDRNFPLSFALSAHPDEVLQAHYFEEKPITLTVNGASFTGTAAFTIKGKLGLTAIGKAALAAEIAKIATAAAPIAATAAGTVVVVGGLMYLLEGLHAAGRAEGFGYRFAAGYAWMLHRLTSSEYVGSERFKQPLATPAEAGAPDRSRHPYGLRCSVWKVDHG